MPRVPLSCRMTGAWVTSGDFSAVVRLTSDLTINTGKHRSLRQRARKAIEQIAVLAIGLAQAFLDGIDDELIRHEFARIHVALRLKLAWRAGLRCRPQHVPGGNLWYPEFLLDEASLGSLARAGRS